jgi:SagB-type dehydrogenase family enzyme
MEKSAAVERVVRYHQRTKHRLDRFAAGPDHLDWASQPDPFRRFAGTVTVPLPLAADHQPALFSDLFRPGTIVPVPMTVEAIGALLELSFGLSAWKAYDGEQWALRCNPSSGNLHPTESYVVASGLDGLADGIYHYACRDHLLEHRCAIRLPFTGLLVGLSSIHWREAWKYGERAFRYCQLDSGHALAALRYAAGVLGWQVRLLDAWGDDDLAALLGLDREGDFGVAEREAPDLLCLVASAPGGTVAIEPLVAAAAAGAWQGRANVLSRRHAYRWPAIDQIHQATRKPRTEVATIPPIKTAACLPTPCQTLAAALIRQRRSAQSFDDRGFVRIPVFWRLLDATLSRPGLPPFDVWPETPRVHLLLFIHRVEGLSPGVYLFLRRDGVAAELMALLRPDFQWASVAQCPAHFHLFRLFTGECRQTAKVLCCHQDIAGDSVLSLGMLAEFDAAMAAGNWQYRRLFREAGMIGQALYLEGEAAGLRGTGIGCFFDDAVHELCGLTTTRFQSLYHFTLGLPREDRRLQTLPPYGHLLHS